MEFKKINFSLDEVNFKEDMNQIELFGIEGIAHEVLGFDMDSFSYQNTRNGALYAYHANEGEKCYGLDIFGFKMSKSELYLILSDDEENYIGYRLEFA